MLNKGKREHAEIMNSGVLQRMRAYILGSLKYVLGEAVQR